MGHLEYKPKMMENDMLSDGMAVDVTHILADKTFVGGLGCHIMMFLSPTLEKSFVTAEKSAPLKKKNVRMSRTNVDDFKRKDIGPFTHIGPTTCGSLSVG